MAPLTRDEKKASQSSDYARDTGDRADPLRGHEAGDEGEHPAGTDTIGEGAHPDPAERADSHRHRHDQGPGCRCTAWFLLVVPPLRRDSPAVASLTAPYFRMGLISHALRHDVRWCRSRGCGLAQPAAR
jgi:hypothetical protein